MQKPPMEIDGFVPLSTLTPIQMVGEISLIRL